MERTQWEDCISRKGDRGRERDEINCQQQAFQSQTRRELCLVRNKSEIGACRITTCSALVVSWCGVRMARRIVRLATKTPTKCSVNVRQNSIDFLRNTNNKFAVSLSKRSTFNIHTHARTRARARAPRHTELHSKMRKTARSGCILTISCVMRAFV